MILRRLGRIAAAFLVLLVWIASMYIGWDAKRDILGDGSFIADVNASLFWAAELLLSVFLILQLARWIKRPD